jgi:hypothetical protein
MYKKTEVVRFEVLTGVGVMKICVFSDLTPCSPLKVNGHFGRTSRLRFQGGRISEASSMKQSLKRAGCAGVRKTGEAQ